VFHWDHLNKKKPLVHQRHRTMQERDRRQVLPFLADPAGADHAVIHRVAFTRRGGGDQRSGIMIGGWQLFIDDRC